MNRHSWLPLAMTAGLLAGCPGMLTANQTQALQGALSAFGVNLSTVDPTTGQAVNITSGQVSSVVDDSGNPVNFSFDSSGRMQFKPNKAGKQTITIKLKDGTSQKITIDATTGNQMQTGSFAFIPDSTGQGFGVIGGIGQTVNAAQQFQQQEQQLQAHRVTLTFNGAGLPGLTEAEIAKGLGGLFLDRQRIPDVAFNVDDQTGELKVDPNVFYMVKQYQAINNAFPTIRVAYVTKDQTGNTQLTVAICTMSALPQGLPDWTPPQPGQVAEAPPSPDEFNNVKGLDLTILRTDQATDLGSYMQANNLVDTLPQPGQAPPPPDAQDNQNFLKQIDSKAITFQTGQTLPSYTAPAPLPNGAPPQPDPTSGVQATFIGPMLRPAMDVLSMSPNGDVKVDPMVIFQMRAYQFLRLNQTATDLSQLTAFPAFRVVYRDSGQLDLLTIRINPTANIAADMPWWPINFIPQLPQGFQMPTPGSGGQGAPPPILTPPVDSLNVDSSHSTIPAGDISAKVTVISDLGTFAGTLQATDSANP